MSSEKVALIDTVNPGFERMLEDRIREVVDPRGIDYVVMNHAEPDHVGAVLYVLNIAPKAKLITTSVGLKMAKIFYGVPMERVHVVRDGDVIPPRLKDFEIYRGSNASLA
jgi:flavorubredoxin